MATLPPAVLDEWRKKYPGLTVLAKLKSGKEASLWHVRSHGISYALKVYDNADLSTRSRYTEGRWLREPSLRKAVRQKTKVGRGLQQKLWTKREYYLLKKLRKQGAIVPAVFAYADNAILMEYLGNEDAAAPRLVDVVLDPESKSHILQQVERSMQLFLDNGIVHADLSPYNILWWRNQPWIIDFPQAADIRYNSNWHELYERDLQNVRAYFN